MLVTVAFQETEKRDLDRFVKSQVIDYRVVRTDGSSDFTISVDRQELHSRRRETLLKAKTPHANRNSHHRTVYARIRLYTFDFRTKPQCRQATDSLLQCFPYDCAAITRNKEQPIKVTPSVTILNQNSICIAVIACEQVDKKWERFKWDFVQAFAGNDSEIILTECGKLTWTKKSSIKNVP